MRDLSFLKQPPVEEPRGLETTDPRFLRISALADDGRYREAADAIESLLAEGIVDIRLVVFVLFDAFIEGGIARLPEIAEGLSDLLAPGQVRFGPKSRRDRHVQKSLTWLMDRVEQTLTFHRVKADETWQRLLADADTVDRSLVALKSLAANRDEPTRAALDESSSRLMRALRDLAEPLRAAALEETAPPEARLSSEPERLDIIEPSDLADTLEIRVAPPLRELLSKIRAFEVLVERGDHRKAALVAKDVQETIERFDPLIFLPDLFSRFGALLYEHIDAIAPQWEMSDTIGWRMLEQFYRVDLDAFVGGSSGHGRSRGPSGSG